MVEVGLYTPMFVVIRSTTKSWLYIVVYVSNEKYCTIDRDYSHCVIPAKVFAQAKH